MITKIVLTVTCFEILVLSFILIYNQPKNYKFGKYINLIFSFLITIGCLLGFIVTFVINFYGMLPAFIFFFVIGVIGIIKNYKFLLHDSVTSIKIKDKNYEIKTEETNFLVGDNFTQMPTQIFIVSGLKLIVPTNINIPKQNNFTIYYNKITNTITFIEVNKNEKINVINIINKWIIIIGFMLTPIVLGIEYANKETQFLTESSIGLKIFTIALFGSGMKLFDSYSQKSKSVYYKIIKYLLSLIYYFILIASIFILIFN